MKQHTANYKNDIKKLGRQLESKITYTLNNEEVELDGEVLNSIVPHYEGGILKSVMKQLDIDSNVDIPIGTEINYQFGLLVGNSYEYLDFGNYIVYSSEKQEDTRSWKIVAYDKMLYSMKDYANVFYTFPMDVRTYIGEICNTLGLTFSNANDMFANYNRQIPSDVFLQENGSSLGYTFRDVLDQLAEVTGSTICINDNDELEIRYINTIGTTTTVEGTSLYITNAVKQRIGEPCYGKQSSTLGQQLNDLNNGYLYDGVNNISQTNNDLPFNIELTYMTNTALETIDEEYLKDINVNFGEKYGPVNSIVLSRSAESDNIYLRNEESIERDGLCEIKIKDNQIMNFNDRGDYLPDIFNVLNGLEYYLNDFSSTGITYLDLCDQYYISIDGNTYPCIMFNDEIDVTQGLQELIHTDMPEESETDYKKADTTDRRNREVYLIVDKQKGEINSVVQDLSALDKRLYGDEATGTTGDIVDLGTKINQKVDQVTFDVYSAKVDDIEENGATKVKTTSVIINNEGLNVSTSTSKISTTMANNEFKITDSGGTKLAKFGYDEDAGISVAEMDNLTVQNYFIAGVHRVETINIDGEDRTGYFYIGG